MIRYFLVGSILLLCSININYAQTKAPAPFGPVPNENQMRWQEMEYYAFVHFSLNTYTDQSWGYGNEDVNLFNPERFGLPPVGSYLQRSRHERNHHYGKAPLWILPLAFKIY